ncbi:MAG: cell division protein ZapA [Mariniphaga sp.]|nr:cell division protein ZapA [Mariniphaga sp.]MDD4424601.1 cell division protein ZapA [Mariniphaga sp.]
MGNKEQLKINIRIEGRSYPLYIERKNEERHRIAAGIVNDMVNKFKELYQHTDIQDLLAMAAFQIALNFTELTQNKEKSLLLDEIKNIKDDISDFLKEEIKA